MNHKEADIIINGHKLTYAESMTLRVAVSSMLFSYDDPNALGEDDHGRSMVKYYKRDLSEIQEYIFDGLN